MWNNTSTPRTKTLFYTIVNVLQIKTDIRLVCHDLDVSYSLSMFDILHRFKMFS